MAQYDQKPYLTYALNEDGKLVHIENVSTGLACNCFCPHCKSELIAKNSGYYKVHHFAHSKGSDCIGAKESALHKMAKDILQEHKLIMLPPLPQNWTREPTTFDKVEIEVFDKELSLRPDCIGYTTNGGMIWVEFKRTHEVDVKKTEKIISAKIDCIEIDLNSCELDLLKVKDFIESSNENRKWIYNHECSDIFQLEKNNRNPQETSLCNYDFGQKEPRHIAVNEQNSIVNLTDKKSVYSNEHTYYCIACGKKVHIKEGSFIHSNMNTPCGDDFYLHEAAKKILCERFNTQQTFSIYIPQIHVCENRLQCQLYNEKNCSCTIPISYDLKAHGYDSCEIEYKFPDEQFPYDVVLKRGSDLKNAIIIIIDADGCYIEHKNITNRYIELFVTKENDILDLYEKPISGEIGRIFNFTHKDVKTTSWNIINRKVFKFTLFSSGKYYYEDNCMSLKKHSAIYEMIIPNHHGDSKSMRQYAILHCYKKQKILCLCEICFYLRNCGGILNNDYICIRYKTKGTPRNPLKTRPIECQHFDLDRRLETDLEKEYQNLDFYEKDLSANE